MGDVRMCAELAKQAQTFHIPDRTSEQWADVLGVYLDALQPLSSEMLDEAFVRWNRSELYPREPGRHAFFPKPAELFALAERSRLEIGKALYRARRAMEHVEKLPPPTPSPEERGARRQQLIDAGFLNPDGSVNLAPPKTMPTETRTRESHAAMAERIRARADDDDAAETA